MKKAFYSSVLAKKSLGLGAIVFLGVGAHSFAQTPPPLPPLAPLQDISVAANDLPPLPAAVPAEHKASAAATTVPEITVGAPTLTTADAVSSVPIPALPPLTPADSKAVTATNMAPPTLPPLPNTVSGASSPSTNTVVPVPAKDNTPLFADLPAMDDVAPEKPRAKPTMVTDKNKAPTESSTENKDTASIEAPPLPPMLPLPGADTATANAPAMPPIPLPTPALGAVSSQKIKIADAEKEKKTWQTVLAPTDAPVETHFNFRRQMLPNTIYRMEYSNENQHLPVLVTRQDYEGLLFASVMKNDVEATRSLLNAGTNIDAVNANGESLLTVAHNSGAMATEKLLLARGGR